MLGEAGADLPVAIRGSMMRVRGEASADTRGARRKGKGKKRLDAESDEEEDDSQQSERDEDVDADAAAGTMWEKYTVVDTRPLLQGVVDAAHTLIVVLPPTAKKTTTALSASLLSSSRLDEQQLDISSAVLQQERPKRSLESPLLLSSFILPSCRSLLSSSNAVSPTEGDRSTERQPNAAVFEVAFLPRPLKTVEPGSHTTPPPLSLLSLIPTPTPAVPSWRDEMTEVGLSLSTLRQLRLFSGSTVRAAAPTRSGSPPLRLAAAVRSLSLLSLSLSRTLPGGAELGWLKA
jgi:hypothetical protein